MGLLGKHILSGTHACVPYVYADHRSIDCTKSSSGEGCGASFSSLASATIPSRIVSIASVMSDFLEVLITIVTL